MECNACLELGACEINLPMTNKIEPFRGHFENFRALLARIAEDDEAIGMVGCIKYKDGSMKPVSFDATLGEMALASAIWGRKCLESD